MAINIYSGGSSAKTPKTPRVSSASERAQATTSAINGPAAASDSGSTAVKSGGILGKIGSVVNKVAGTLGNFLPGPAGMIAKTVADLTSTNDPEWWQHVPGDGLTVNAPLIPITEGNIVAEDSSTCRLLNDRPTFLEFKSIDTTGELVINITDRMATQYLLPAVRKVANAIVPQSAAVYSAVFARQATIYAIWRYLKKCDFFIKHGFTFVPNLNDPAYPVFQVANAAWLQSTITRLEEYLHSHVRLPHTLCEYLSWRYGRIFRTNNSAKAGFVFYNPVYMSQATSVIDTLIAGTQTYISASQDRQTAAADLFNAYLDHDQEVLMPDASMIAYDSKEFCLRTNLDIDDTGVIDPWTLVDASPIIIDSNLDNATVFMASTVSTTHDNSGQTKPLFPVTKCRAYMARQIATDIFEQFYAPYDASGTEFQSGVGWQLIPASNTWFYLDIKADVIGGKTVFSGSRIAQGAVFLSRVQMSVAAKAVDLYNVGIFVQAKMNSNASDDAFAFVDLTSLSMDCGSVPDLVIANEQVLAFANLVSEENKHADTYRQAEKRVAKDVANFIENNEVAALAK